MYRIIDTAPYADGYDDGERYATIADARAAVRDPSWSHGYDSDTTEATWWVDYDIIEIIDGAPEDDVVDTVTIAIHPEEPPCTEPEHAWQDGQPYGDGAGVRYTDTCTHCGLERVTESRPQRRDNGAYAPTERVSYRRDGERWSPCR